MYAGRLAPSACPHARTGRRARPHGARRPSYGVRMATTYAALLRGINVGGGKKVPMAELRTLMEGLGYDGVRTYLQSGKAVFAPDRGRRGVTGRGTRPTAIETALRVRRRT